MKIAEISALLKRELYENNYQYGFYLDGIKYTPNFRNGFDEEFFQLSKTVYRIQNPQDTRKEKIGTCIDAVIVMKTILDEINVPSKIWLLYHNVKKTPHTILTFEAEELLIYLELTPQSSKPWYGKEICYSNEQSLIEQFQKENYTIVEITDKIVIGDSPDSMLQYVVL